MKNSILITVLFAVTSVFAVENEPENNPQAAASTIDQTTAKISSVKNDLLEMGYTDEMINDVFGDENFYFPKSSEELELTIYVVDKIIGNGQYKIHDRSELVAMSITALFLFEKTPDIINVTAKN